MRISMIEFPDIAGSASLVVAHNDVRDEIVGGGIGPVPSSSSSVIIGIRPGEHSGSQVQLSREDARDLFNWLGVWLHQP